MNSFRRLTLSGILVLPVLLLAQPQSGKLDPKATIGFIRTLQNEAREKAAKKEPVDQIAVQATVKAKATEAITGVDPKKVSGEDAEDWSELFRLAGKSDEARQLSEASMNFHATKAWLLQNSLLSDYLQQGDKAKILQTLDYAQGNEIRMLGQTGEFVIYGLAPKYSDTDPQFVLNAYDLLLRRVSLKNARSDEDRSWIKFALARLTANRDALLYKTGHQTEALADMKKMRTAVAGEARAEGTIDEVIKQLSLTGTVAPEIVADRKIGAYAGLSSLRGKVVLVDFFAHWCGPCKKAFPAMRDLYTASKGKGLEMVGVTSIQGYYEDQQGIAPDAEFALMRDKFVPEFKMNWPVIFEKGKAATKAYGVSAIPHLVVIDRAGKVRRIVVGYTPAEFAGTKALVEKLLQEPAPAIRK